jgi:8-oxo-dGTP pyrophosphatase MutT (NUDIX family)
MEINKNVSACVVLINPEGLILAVSRKDDHTSMGLPGGKMDPEDNNDAMLTAIRECKEETGLDVTNLNLVFAIHKDSNMGFTFLADYSGEIKYDEPHLVKWVTFDVLINGRFGKYNKMVSESLDSMGIKYQKSIDK